ncbi:MAG TPA: CPBP family glutamic-type intramembrane protease, partial [Planctomycetota bacterium]|nr:CPBP family glutamic-type intramembrane protease [Planctomycetota bacterium]
QAPMMVLLGLYFGTLVWLTGSLWAGVIAHAANNFAVLVVTQKYGSAAAAFRAPWWMYVLSAVVFAGAMVLLAIDRRERDRFQTL